MARKKAAASPDAGVIDPAHDATAAEIVRSVADATEMPTEAMADDRDAAAETKRVSQPDPHMQQTIALTAAAGGPKMRLFRNRREGVVAVQFDERPAAEHTARLRDAGFDWDGRKDKVWKRPLEPGAEWKGQLDAEKVFREIGAAIRAENGLGESRDIPI